MAAARRWWARSSAPALVTAALLAGAAAVLSACSTTPSASTTSTSAPSGGPGPGSSTTANASTTPALTTCSASSLAVSVAGSGGAAGTLELTFALKNTSMANCQLYGFPGAQLYGAGGAALATDVVRAGAYSFTDFAPAVVDLAPGAVALFNMGYSDVVSGTSSCSQATSMWVTPPNDVDHAVVSVQVDACSGGKLTVSPVFSSSSAGTHTTAPPTSGG